jgi:hypothetical protein
MNHLIFEIIKSIKDKTKLNIIEVTMGIYITKFFFLITMSPGNFPKKGILSKTKRSTPINRIILPNSISTFPMFPSTLVTSEILFRETGSEIIKR